jgi:hypothetical protein
VESGGKDVQAVNQSPEKSCRGSRHVLSRVKKAPGASAFLDSLLAEVTAAVLATENCSWLADEAVASGVPIIVTAVVAVVVGI